MSRISKLEPIVKEILEESKEAREDDMYLYYLYVGIMYARSDHSHDLEDTFKYKEIRKEHNISPYHSVARCRRKLQRDYIHLKPEDKVQEARINETAEYIDYAIDGYNSNFMRFVDSQE